MTSPTPRVGIIVLNWNGLEDTRACLLSLRALEGPPPQIYVVDNGSTDGSVEALFREYGEAITILANRRNLLWAGGNNVGIVRALADGCTHLLLLNNDTLVDQRLLTALLAAQEETGPGLFCPKIYYARQPDLLWYAGGRLSLGRARFAHRGIRDVDHGQYDRLEETGWATGCALFAPRQVWERVGLLDESFELYSEDVDYSLRARAAGYPVVFVPQAKVWHKVSASLGGNLSRRKLTRKWASLKRLLRKHQPNTLRRCWALTDFLLTEPPRVLLAGLRGKLK